MLFPLSIFVSSGLSVFEKINTWYQNSVIYELLNYLKEQYFTVEFGTYENISIAAGTGTNVTKIILGIAFGILVAGGISVYLKAKLGGFVRKLIKEGANSPENAKTLYELGYFKNAGIRRELTRGVNLSKVVKSPEEDAFRAAEAEKRTAYEEKQAEDPTLPPFAEVEYKPNFSSARFYIPEDLRYRAEIRYDKKGSGLPLYLLVCFFTVAAVALLCRFLPDIIQLMDNFITMMAP